MAVRIGTDGTVTAAIAVNGKDFKLEELRKLIGCNLVELVQLPHSGQLMWLDEEGKLNGSEFNPVATILFRMNWGNDDVIMGNVLITDDSEVE